MAAMNQGTLGRPTQIHTNSFELTHLPNRRYYHYDVITRREANGENKEIPVGRRTADIIDNMQQAYPLVFVPRAAFDGVKNLFITKKIEDGTFDVMMGTNPNSNRGRYTVRLALVGQIDPSDIQKLTSSRGADTLGAPANANTIALTLLQVILSQGPQMQHRFSLHAKSFYIRAGSRALSGGIEAWRGFFQSVRATAGKVIVNVDTTTAAFYKTADLISIAMEVLGCRNIRDLDRACAAPQGFQKLRAFLKGVLVIVQPGNRTKRIADLVQRAGHEEFFKDDQKITIAEYWVTHHNKPMRYPDSFGVKIKNGAIFPAEACAVKEGQRYKKKLSPEDTTTFLGVSVWKPEQRLTAIKQAVTGNLFNYAASPWMIESGMQVNSNPMNVTGRTLQTPRVIYGSSTVNVNNGAWNMIRQKFRMPARIHAWAVVVFDSASGVEARVDAFLGALEGHMRSLGMTIDRPPYKGRGNPHDVNKDMQAAALSSVANAPALPDGTKPKPSFVLAILPPAGYNEVRKEIKQWGDVLTGIPTQCVRTGKYDGERGRDQYCSNVALKINMKCGGINSYVQPQNVTELLQECMVVGCDVTHPAPGVFSRPSVASLVSSIDNNATRYKVHLDAQPPRQEVITNIAVMLEAALKSFQRRRNKLPKTIVIYRDGVSEGEYWKVDEQEIQKIEGLLAGIGRATKAPPPQLVFVVVGKRHHVRFFPRDRAEGDKSGNCHPGLVVDNAVVHSKLMDFYLQSHGGLLGTSRPSHYVVLRNGPQWTADQLQELSYALCFVYAAATRSVSIPAPVYYADKVCTRAEFQFDPRLRYDDDGSTDNSNFDLEKWQKGLKQSPLSSDMYFI